MADQEPRWNDYYAMQDRAMRAEAEVERLAEIARIQLLALGAEIRLADELAKALRAEGTPEARNIPGEGLLMIGRTALARYEEARRG